MKQRQRSPKYFVVQSKVVFHQLLSKITENVKFHFYVGFHNSIFFSGILAIQRKLNKVMYIWQSVEKIKVDLQNLSQRLFINKLWVL